jgi:hypothetical protein
MRTIFFCLNIDINLFILEKEKCFTSTKYWILNVSFLGGKNDYSYIISTDFDCNKR